MQPRKPGQPHKGWKMAARKAKERCAHAGSYQAKRPPTCGCKACQRKWEHARDVQGVGLVIHHGFDCNNTPAASGCDPSPF